MAHENGQADVNITPEMIEAGAILLLETDAWYDVSDQTRDLAKRVFQAMLAARPAATTSPPTPTSPSTPGLR